MSSNTTIDRDRTTGTDSETRARTRSQGVERTIHLLRSSVSLAKREVDRAGDSPANGEGKSPAPGDVRRRRAAVHEEFRRRLDELDAAGIASVYRSIGAGGPSRATAPRSPESGGAGGAR